MKKSLLLIAFFLSIKSYSQNNILLTLKWNTNSTRYEVYAKSNFTKSSFTWGPSQIGIVLPESAPNQAISITSVGAGSWIDRSRVFAPLAAASNDFHGIVSDGDLINLVSGVESLIFTFILPDGQCRNGVRLFVNASDPSSSAAGMGGGDFKTTIFSGAEIYGGNYNNTGSQCSACSVIAPELIKN
jgi:hypothetical protein